MWSAPRSAYSPEFLCEIPLLVQKSQTTTWMYKNHRTVNNEISYQPQLLTAGFLNHQQYHHLSPFFSWNSQAALFVNNEISYLRISSINGISYAHDVFSRFKSTSILQALPGMPESYPEIEPGGSNNIWYAASKAPKMREVISFQSIFLFGIWKGVVRKVHI